MTRQLSHRQGEEISRHDFDPWEYAELDSLRNKVRRKAYLIRLWGKLWHKKESSNLPSDPPVVRFWKVPGNQRLCIYLQWVKGRLEDALDVPQFVWAKAREIASCLPEATFTVEQLQSERRIYDPFLIVSYADESYYIAVWTRSSASTPKTSGRRFLLLLPISMFTPASWVVHRHLLAGHSGCRVAPPGRRTRDSAH